MLAATMSLSATPPLVCCGCSICLQLGAFSYSGQAKEDIILHTLYVEFAPPMLALRLCRICVYLSLYASIHSLLGYPRELAFSRQSQQTMDSSGFDITIMCANPLHGARIWRLST